MASTIQCGRRTREDFGKIPSIVEIPNLIEIQRRSYEQFLQKDVAPERREETGLQAVFKSVFPIADYNDNALLEFDSYHFGDPKYTVEECHDRGMTFAIPLKVTLRLVVYDHDKEAKTRTIREQRGQEVYLGELPLMTEKGTFIINGTERVVVSQLQRSAGVFFDDDKGKTVASGKLLYSATSSSCGWTAAARCWPRPSCAPSPSSRRASSSPMRRSSGSSTTPRKC
jgi:DNA-directed RNA polymerase subunit beta